MAESAGLAARAAALDLLRAVVRERRPLDAALAQSIALAALAPRDRAWCRALVATTLRRLGQIDAALAACLDKPLKPGLAVVHDALRLAAAQLLFLDTPAHAAVDTTVELVRRRGQGRLAGLANAVTAAHLGDPPLDLTLKPGADAEDWARRLDAMLLPTGTLRRATARVDELDGYAEGAWWVQDVAAALPARLAGDVAGRRVLDLCAAPGGKTAQLAAAGAQVTAIDVSKRRLARVGENLARLGLAAELVAADAAAFTPSAPADAVLLDAPCTATGTIRRHPDIAVLKTPADVAACVALQRRLLDAAATMVAPGGVLIYAVCSLQPEEGPDQVAALLARHAELRRAPVDPAEVAGLADLVTAEGDLRTLPCHLAAEGGMDGFYVARLRRGPVLAGRRAS